MSQIICENLSLGYSSNVIIRDLSFCVDSGEYLCITGENGSGKSTLVKAILGLKAPLAGRITFSEGLTKSDISYLPQQTESQKDFPASVMEIVLSGCQGKSFFHPFYNSKDKRLASESMSKMNIRDLAFRCYRELSGGQQQRVLLARALCSSSKVLILDEPVSGLDPQAAHNMYKIVGELNQSGVTIIMISHDIEYALKYSSRVLKLTRSE